MIRTTKHFLKALCFTYLLALFSTTQVASAACPSGPNPQADSVSLLGANPVLIDVLANDSHACGIPITVTSATLDAACSGNVVINIDHTLTFTPGPAFAGTCTIDYEITDQDAGTATAVVSVGTTAPPLVVMGPEDTEVTEGEEVQLQVSVSGGFPDYQYTWQGSFTPEGPFADLSPDLGTFFGVDTPTLTILAGLEQSLYYRCVVTDSLPQTVESNAAHLTVHPLTACEDPPQAHTDFITVNHGDPPFAISDEFILSNDLGVDLSQPAHSDDWMVTAPDGTLIPQIPGGWTYTAPTEFQSFDSFTYKVISQGDETCYDVGTVEITILPEEPPPCEDPPQANTDFITVTHGDPPFAISDEFILSNDLGIDLSQPANSDDWVVTAPDGTLIPQIPGGWTYTAPTEFQSFDSFTYKVISQGDETCYDVGTVEITIEPPPCTSPPQANTDFITAVPGGPPVVISDEFILSNDVGVDLSQPANVDDWVVTDPIGTLIPQIPGGWTYTPPTPFQAQDSFTYRVISGGDETCSDVGTVEITMLEADFNRTCVGLTCTFDGSPSLGSASTYQWTFGDGTSGSGETVQHTYSGHGNYSVTLTLTAPGGAQAAKTLLTELVVATDDAYSVVFGSTLSASLAGVFANDLGPNLRFAGFTGTPSAGTLTQQLSTFEYTPTQCAAADSVDYGVLSSTASYSSDTGTLLFTILPDEEPTPAFEATCDLLACSFTDLSTDDSGYSIVGWDFGDGSLTTTAAMPSHTFPGNGTYTVELTVEDLCGQRASVSQEITVELVEESDDEDLLLLILGGGLP